MPAPEDIHIPVLAETALEWLAVRPDGIYVDGTAGAGGHASRIAAQLQAGRLIALDRDPAAVALAAARLREFSCATVLRTNYGELDKALAQLGVGGVDGVLIDAGVSSLQLDTAERGFSFQEDGPLDMRMDPERDVSAAEWLAEHSEETVAEVLRRYGDVKPARRIARAIARRCGEGRMRTTRDLTEAVGEALSFVHGVPDEVRTVFQAVRIAVNEELRWLEAGVRAAIDVLNPGGRLVVISFHSGEDRVVKDVLRTESRPQRRLQADGRVAEVIAPRVRLLTPKPVTPSADEVRDNPRAKSAKLRAAERRTPE